MITETILSKLKLYIQTMSNWTKKLFIERADLFLKLMNQRWTLTDGLANGMSRLLETFGIKSGTLLDLCCGNGRVSIFMAKKGFKAVGVDMSKTFIEDAKRKAEQHGVVKAVTFLEGDVRKLKNVINPALQPFDVVVSAWTSIGLYSKEDDLSMFKQARQLSREGAILFVAETTHTEYLSIKFASTSYTQVGDMVMLENRKYDPIKAWANTSWTFYSKRGNDLEYVDRVDLEHHVYSLSELSALLRKAGWETIASYGNLSTLQSMTPLTSMNIVAKAT